MQGTGHILYFVFLPINLGCTMRALMMPSVRDLLNKFDKSRKKLEAGQVHTLIR